MKIMFIGLGLIGGSMAMALEGYPDLECYAVDGDEPTRLEALGRNVVRAAWPNADDAPIEDMDVIISNADLEMELKEKPSTSRIEFVHVDAPDEE